MSGAIDRALRRSAEAAAGATGDPSAAAAQRVRSAQRLLEDAREGVDPEAAVDLSVNAAVRQAATGRLPDEGDPASRTPADARWNRDARSADEAPLLRARSAPIAESVADDLEELLSEVLPVGFDGDLVAGVDEAAFETIQQRIAAVANGGDVGREAVRILAERYGLSADAPLPELAEQLAGGIAGQRTSLYEGAPAVVRDSRLQRISENPFPERPSSLEGFPEATETFEPIDVEETFRIPRFEYDRLGRLKTDGDGNPVARLDPEGKPTFETVRRRRIVPHRIVDGQAFPMPDGEFTLIGRRRRGSDGNRSAEQVSFVLDRGDGTYQISQPTSGGYKTEVVDEGALGRRMIESGFERISGPELGFTANAPTVGQAEALGRMLFESMRPGGATPEQLAEVVRQIDAIGEVYDGALSDLALRAAGFQSVGSELPSGARLLDEARELLAREPAAATPPQAAAPRRPVPAVINVRPGGARSSIGSGTADVAGAAVRRARNLSEGQDLLTPAQRETQDLAGRTVSGPAGELFDVVSGPADASVFLGPDGQPLTAGSGAGFALFGDAPPISLYPPDGQKLREGRIGGTFETDPVAGIVIHSYRVGDDVGFGSTRDTGTLPGAVPVTMDASLSTPDRLDVLQGLSDVATPATPVMNFDFSGDWARATGRGPAVDATWRNKDYDQPVRVTGLAGEIDGVRYYSIEGSGTAIPESELDFGGSSPPGATRSGPTVAGTIDVGGVDTVLPIGLDDAERARRQFAELSNRQASVRAITRQFPGWEATDDLGEIFRRMEEAREVEPAFDDLDVAEQFEMASMGQEELQALATDLDDELASTPSPLTLTQSQSAAGPVGGEVLTTADNLDPISTTLGTAARVRQAADPTAPPARPSSSPSDVAFGIDPNRQPPSQRRAREQRAVLLQAQADAAARKERLLSRAENMYNPPPPRPGETDAFPSTPEQVQAFVSGSEDFFRLSEADRAALLRAIGSPDAVTEALDATISQRRALRDELRGAQDAAAPREADGDDAVDVAAQETPDDVRDIPEQRAAAGAELEESEANADFYNAQRANSGAAKPLPLRRAQDIVRRALGIQRGQRLPLAFGSYDSRFGQRISRQDIERANAVQAEIAKYRDMSDDTYERLRARNTDLPETRQAKIGQLDAEFGKLGRLVARDTSQDADPVGANQARLIQQLFSGSPRDRQVALRELFAVEGLRDPEGNIVGGDGLAVLQMLARDPAYGSVENVLYDVLSRDPVINNPEAAVGRVVDEQGVERVAAAAGPESLRALARDLAEDTAAYSARRLGPDELNEAFNRDGLTPGAAPQWLPDSWGSPTSPDAPTETPVRPSFIDRLRNMLSFGRGREDVAPAGPQVVTRQGLDTAEAEIAAATTPEEMNAILARINRVREEAVARLDDATDPPTADGPLDDGGPRTVEGWAGPVEVSGRGPSGAVRSARQQIIERSDALIDAWRRRMERMQAAGGAAGGRSASDDLALRIEADNAFAQAYDEARQTLGDELEAVRAGQAARRAVLEGGGRQVSAEEADALALPQGETGATAADLEPSAEPRARAPGRTSASAQERSFNPAGYTIVFDDPDSIVNLGLAERNRLLQSIDRRIFEATAGQRGRTGSEIVQPDSLASLRQERAAIATPQVTQLANGRVSVQFAPGLDPVEGQLLRPVETDFGLVPPTFESGLVGVDFAEDGSPTLRRQGNVIDRRGQDVAFDPVPEVSRSGATVVPTPRIELPPGYRWSESGVAVPAAATTATARSDGEILQEFAQPSRTDDAAAAADPEPVGETYAYDSEDLDVGADEARISDDIEGSLTEPTPGRGRAAATREYEAEQARRSGGRSGGRITARRLATGAGALGAASIGGSAGYQALVGAGALGGLGLAPMASAYAGEAAASAAGDINNSVEPAGSQVRRARRLSYLTTQNPLPY